ncbi:MAG: protein arginine kinase [Candidatus Raymondbacteria bacterium RifOxyC12_full_50_8]|uniref:Protein arginine kinase n=1 Tax=Candidatus Raymondbacteria bacterium RIFOXYD12_FULL_49_13 TaxID=1817890 RepID=A0A1F7F074_UNCRA|nr:MAG: protein arginine kinase [Candidatus Raymondbacteria bacterium RIFOXYA2_FULL_49_16]OGK00049.1 MAG: protein arginine kinase [Candidatus Raymondbacteria bacterium RIFOXYD12_FULL_49_13]OGK01339.1 MAG: protein arginine kinase [Candidatus Raymondbacteria bacterium RifOxyC12_full_50_8]OGK03666.1 MAG: protein arginine kinase [Candidatus Raymondbacteria bacterium RifOxyB12_full_50_8]OGP45038.1 MAG: protein arginine kinase [Candidatus Raymondbacteria bacterium RIFOXYB2_FULL_49_35]
MVDFESLIAHHAAWLDGSGPESGVVLSSRIRLARNVHEFPFVHRASKKSGEAVYAMVRDEALKSQQCAPAFSADMDELSPLDRRILVERHLISPDFERAAWKRGVIASTDEHLSVMINEEDHLRLQAMVSGFDTGRAWEILNKLDTDLSGRLAYAFSEKYGFLTACPTNVGTGIRVSALIHLPALVITKDIDETLKGITQIGLSVRGFYGEGTEVLGNLFQISNHTTLGKTEEEIIQTINSAIAQLIRFEKRACETLLKDAKAHIEDKIWRAYGILNNARLLTSNEFMSLSSALRMGIMLGIITNISFTSLNQLMILVQPAHLQKFLKHEMEAGERDFFRANIVREHLSMSKKGNA